MGNGEVKCGYKKTDLGVIPTDWDDARLGALCTLVNGRGFKPHEWRKSGYPIIRIQNLNGSDDYNYFSGLFHTKLLVESDQLLFAWSGSRGTSFGPHVWRGQTAVLNYHTWKVVTVDKKVDPRFFFHALRQLTKKIEDAAHGASALVHTQKREMENYLVPAPQSLDEQRAIAAALSDADALIASLDALIAKKRNLKQATMQQLLTGKTRLPGFTSEWEMKRLGDVGRALIGLTYRPSDIRSSGTLVLRSSNIQNGSLAFDDNVFVGLEAAQGSMVEVGDLLICARNGSRDLIGKSARLDQRARGMAFGAFMALYRSEINDFISFQFQSDLIKRQINEHLGATINQITNQSLLSFLVPIPGDRAEQTAIVEVLTDMDVELVALEARRDKARALKQGMMQELLTGRIRLV